MSAIKTARVKYGMTQQQLSDFTGVPLRTLQGWELGERTCPAYVERLLLYFLEHEKEEKTEVIE